MAPTKTITFVPVGDMIGAKHGVLDDHPRDGRRILVSPAMYSLLESDKALVLLSLMVETGERLVWVMDLN